MVGNVFDPQIFSAMLAQMQPGAALTEVHFQAVETVLDLLPENDRFCERYSHFIRDEMRSVRENGMTATEHLAAKVQLLQPYIIDPKRGDDDKELLRAATRLKRLLGLRDSGRLPPAARLNAPLGNGSVEDVTETNAVARYLNDILFTPNPPAMPASFDIGDHRVASPDDPVLAEMLIDYFGEGVTPQMLFNLIRLIPGYTFEGFSIKQNAEGHISVWGTIKPENRTDLAAMFYIEIPKRPSEDPNCETEPPPWTAVGKHFYVDDPYRDNGLGSGLLLQFLAFLRFVQLDGLDAPAQSNGKAFWASKGFEPRGHNGLLKLKRQFADYLQQTGLFTDDVKLRIQAVRDLARIADFEIDGRKVGYEFLATHGAKILPLRFHLRPNYFGWLRLIPTPYPIEWDSLSKRTRDSLLGRFELQQSSLAEIMLSDHKEGIYLSNWIAHEALILQGVERSGGNITEHLQGIAEVLNMVHRLKGEHVWHYFTNRINLADMSDVLRLARARGIAIDLEIPEARRI